MAYEAAMAGVAAGQAVIATQAAHDAKVSECRVVLMQYEPKSATTNEMQEYASCVDFLHPRPVSHGEVIALKALFVIALLGMVVGVYRSKKDRMNELFDHFMFGLMGFVFLPAGVVGVAAICAGIGWLFT